MPFKSAKQRRYLHAKEPELAEKWEDEAKKSGTKPVRPKKAKKTPKKGKK